ISLLTSTFRFFGTNYTGNSLNIATNGLVTFNSGNSEYINADLSGDPSQAAIAALWDDLVTNTNIAPDDLILDQFQDLNNDGTPEQLVICWRNAHYYGNGPGTYTTNGITFSAVLQLNTGSTDGEISYYYADLDEGTGAGGSAGSNKAGSATVGVKDVGA